MRRAILVLGWALFFLPASAFAQAAPLKAHLDFFKANIRPVLVSHCYSCHSKDAEKPKGDFRVDQLSPDFSDAAGRDRWQAVVKRVIAGEMPPKSKPRPPEKDIQSLRDWITGGLKAADARRAAEGRVVLRRLNRVEYENTVRDLLGVAIDLKDQLPQDGSAGGFDNVAEALHVSTFLLEKYLEAADKALNLAIANGPKPPPLIKKRYNLKETRQVKIPSERVFRPLDDAVVLFTSSPWQAIHLYEFYPPDRGNYRFRISASGFQSSGKPVTYRLDTGLMGMTGKNHLVGYFDARADQPTVLEFVDYLEARSTFRILPYGLASAQTVHKIGADKYEGTGLAVQWVEVEGPLHDSWPPESHRRIFGDLPRAPAPIYNRSDRVEVVSKNPDADAERILRAFARRAFRRAVTDDDIKPFLSLVKARLADKYSFEQAVRVGLMGVMVSPNFLFLREDVGAASQAAPGKKTSDSTKLDDFALASRLSYFLWSTLPDEELLTLAEQRKLAPPQTLRLQVERMLKDPKAAAFTENFVGQWLGLRDIDATIPSHILYPDYDDMLKHSMLKETYLFWDDVLKNDLSLTNFVHSDFTMLNGRLAKHYGIPDVNGWEFKKVPLPKDSHRGGVLTMASVLKVTANGTYTSPILRGAWVLERILGTPPPRPPEGVVAVEPDIRGATTIRQQLAKHRSVASCASCHAKIDPPGFALESFDVIGGWRDYYVLDGRKANFRKGKKVEPADVLADGRSFKDIDEFKQLLLKDKDQIARNLTERLVTYATGATTLPADNPEIEAIIRTIRAKDYGLRTLVHEIVQSKLFLHK